MIFSIISQNKIQKFRKKNNEKSRMLNFSDKTGLFLVTLKGKRSKQVKSYCIFIIIREKLLTKPKDYNIINSADFSIYGGIAQLARAFGSYPKCRRFKSYFRYYGPVVKRLRHRPFTAVTRVRFSSGSPPPAQAGGFISAGVVE